MKQTRGRRFISSIISRTRGLTRFYPDVSSIHCAASFIRRHLTRLFVSREITRAPFTGRAALASLS